MVVARPAPSPIARRGRRMKTVRQMLYREVLAAIGFVALGFLALFVFFDLVDELQRLTQYAATGYGVRQALMVVALQAPGHLYDLLPISALIGTIYVMARLAQSSEFTILRTGGLGPWRALAMLLRLGWLIALLTFVLGDYVAPWAEQQAALVKTRYTGVLSQGKTGAWLKERGPQSQSAVNVRALDAQGRMREVNIQTFDMQGRLQTTVRAQSGAFGQGRWELDQVVLTQLRDGPQGPVLERQELAQWAWPTDISRDMVSAAIIQPESMKVLDLVVYTRHLAQNQQNALPYEIQLWRRVFYPLSSLVMLTLALPFAYLHFRSGQIAGHVFGGVMAGISFYLLNNVFGHVGNLRNWEPWITSASPSLLYMLIALGAFGWMVWRR